MIRRKTKFLLIWALLGTLAISSSLHGFIVKAGYKDLDALSEDLLFYVYCSAWFIIPVATYFLYRSLQGEHRRLKANFTSYVRGDPNTAELPFLCPQCNSPVANPSEFCSACSRESRPRGTQKSANLGRIESRLR